jgi:hypothetical protein
MSDFSKVVAELKTQTIALNKLAGIEQKLEQQGEEIKQQAKDARRVAAGQKAWQTRQENAQKSSAKATEKQRETERTQMKILGTLKSISGGITSVASGIGSILKDKVKQIGGDIFSKLKKFAFGAAVAGVLAFLNSKYWEDTKKFIIDDLIPALKNLWENVLSPILSVFKDVFVKQWENIKVLFDDLGTAIQDFKDGNILSGITTLVKGLGTFFLTTIDNAITGVYNLVAKLFGWEETDSVWGSIKGAFNDVVQWFKDKFLWLGSTITGAWTSFTGFIQEKWDAVKGWFVEKFTWAKEGITGTWTSLTDFVSDKFTKATEFFTEVFTDPKAALQALWTGLVGDGGLVNLLFAPVDKAITTVTGWFGLTLPEDWSMSKMVTDAFTTAKEWVTGLFSWAQTEGEGGESWTLMGAITEAVKAPIRFIEGLFTFSDEDMNAKGIFTKLIDIVYAPLNLAINFVSGLFGWNEDEEGNRTEFSLGALVTGAVESIWNWFKKLLDIDVNAIIKSIPGAETLMSWFTADAQEQALAAATESGLYDKDWVGNSEVNRDMVASAAREQLEAILADNDISEANRQFILDELQRRASGGSVSAGTPYLVGEAGPELFVPSGAGSVLSAGRTDRLFQGAAEASAIARERSGGGAPVVINNAPTTNNMGGGGGGRGSVFPVSVGDPDPKFRMVAANAF